MKILGYIFISLILLNIAFFPAYSLEESDAQTYNNECSNTLAEAEEIFIRLESFSGISTAASVLQPMNSLEVLLDKGYNKAQLYFSVHPSSDIRNIAEKCQQDFSDLITQITLSPKLYKAIIDVDISKADKNSQRYVQKTLRDFRRSGVDKNEAIRARIKKIQEQLVILGQDFDRNIREDVRHIDLNSIDELEGLPQDYIEKHASKEDAKITINTDYPDYLPFMSYAKNDNKRYELYKKFRNRGYPKNESILIEILTLRYELAKILGYTNYADYITEDKMIKTAGNADDFINKISKIATSRANNDYQILLAKLKQTNPDANFVGDWQKSYIEELVKQEDYQFDSKVLRQYFAYDKVKTGVFKLVKTLFDVDIEPWQTQTWHQSVTAHEMWDGNKLIGRFYLDMHPRDDKYKHAAHFPVQSGLTNKQLPIAALVCNFPGGDGSLGLMDHSQVKTFLHEFGHLLHHIFSGDQQWLKFSGVATERDFVEAPSQMLEEWVWNNDSLKLFASNDKGEVIPDEIIEKMNAARYFGRGLWIKHQMFYAAISLNYYNRDPDSFDLTKLMVQLQEKYSPYKYVDDTHFFASFGHLDGYSAIYYTYMWSLVIASDMFSEFKKQGLLNTAIAKRYRDKVLSPGGSKDAEDLVNDFLGRPYNFNAFEQELNQSN